MLCLQSALYLYVPKECLGFFAIFLLLATQHAFAQKFTISGYVKDAASGEILIGANLYDQISKKGTSTNQFGFFSLTLPKDSVRISCSYVGYQTQIQGFYLDKNREITFQLEAVSNLSEVVVKAERTGRIEENTQMSTISVPIEQIKNLPAALGEVDVLKIIQLMPGVASGSEGSTGLYVRGGSPDQNLILLDGVPLYNVNHLGGFFSVFNADAISHVSLIKGGYPARYGGRLSSVIDIKMRDGNSKEIKGQGSVGIVSAKLSLEGPIIKDKTSFMVSGRRTYLDLFSRPVSKLATDGVASFGYHFYDFNAKINHILSAKDRLYLSAYVGDDKAIVKSEDEYTNNGYKEENSAKSRLIWGNFLTSLRWNHVFSEKLFANTMLNYTRYRFLVDVNQKNTSEDPDSPSGQTSYFAYLSGINDWSGKVDFDFYPNPQHSIKFGAQAIFHTFKPGITAIKADFSHNERTDTAYGSSRVEALETALYIEDDWEITRQLKVNAGLHFSGFFVGNSHYLSLQPRIAARYQLPHNYSLKASYATMQQFVHLLTNSDAGLPTDLWVPVTEKVRPQFSQQTAVGIAKSLQDNRYELSVEAYYKTMRNLIDYKEGATFFGNTTDWQENIETGGKGESYGAELLLQKKTGKVSGWLGYTLSWTNRQFNSINGGKKYPYKYDRRHDLEVAVTYQPKPRISVSASWMYGTGNAITLGVARYPSLVENYGYYWRGDIQNTYNQVQVYEGRNGFRMRSYHRMDLGISFHKPKKWGERTWTISLYNAYSRKNPFYYYIDTDQDNKKVLKQVSLFPIIPSISYSFQF